MEIFYKKTALALLLSLLTWGFTSCKDPLSSQLSEYHMTLHVNDGITSGTEVVFYPQLSLTITGPTVERWNVEVRTEDDEFFTLLAMTDYKETVDLKFKAFEEGATSVRFTVTATTLYEKEVLDQQTLVAQMNKTSGTQIMFKLADIATKATETTISTLESGGFKVTATKGTSGDETAVWNNASFTKSGSVFSGDKWWPISNPNYHFYASNMDLTFHASGTTISPSTNTDAVCAYIGTPNYGNPNTLNFQHVFARIGNVTIQAPNYYSVTVSSVTITPYTSGTYNLRTQEWSGKQPGSAVNLNIGSANDLWCIPGSYTLTVEYTLTRGEYIKTFTKSGTVTLTAGKTNNLTGTLPNGDAVGIEFSISVAGWDSQSQAINFPS